jgi:tyrosinase
MEESLVLRSQIRFDPAVVDAKLRAIRGVRPGADTVLRSSEGWGAVATAEKVAVVRPDQGHLDTRATVAFRTAVRRMVETGVYQKLVAIHQNTAHRMYGAMHEQFSLEGLLRFLPWHRRFLMAFEKELQQADCELRPNAQEPLAVPYWRWPDPFPEWLRDFLPADPTSGNAPPRRRLAVPPLKPTAADVAYVVEGFRAQLPGNDVDDYVRFTWGLEGWGRRADGASLRAHNHVHDWVGGVMSDPLSSPRDPVFWLHHAEVDRLWHIWQTTHPDAAPPLTGADSVMDPWPETYGDLVAIQDLGYAYESAIP